MTRILIDTDVIIDHLRGIDRATQLRGGSQFCLHFFNETNYTIRIAYCVLRKNETRNTKYASCGICPTASSVNQIFLKNEPSLNILDFTIWRF